MSAEEAYQLHLSKQRRGGLTATFGGGAPGQEFRHDREAALERAYSIHQRGDVATDEDLAKAFVGQDSIQGQPLGISARVAMSFFGDTPEEQDAIFNRLHDTGELVRVPNTNIVLYRTAPSEKFRHVDQGILESMASGGGMLSETVSDMGEILASDAAEATFEIVFGRGSGGVIKRIFKAGAGAAFGTVVQEGAQVAAGTSKETVGEVATRATGEAGISIIGGTVGAGIGRAFNLAGGRVALIEPTPEGKAAVKASERLRREGVQVDDPLPIQMVDVPFLRLLGRQAAALLPTIPRRLRAQQETMRRAMQRLSNRGERAKLIKRTESFVHDISNLTVDAVREAVRFKPKDPRRAAQELNKVVTDWWKATGESVDELHALARNAEEPQFDLSPALDEVRRLTHGVRGAGRVSDVLDDAGNVVGQERLPPVQVRDVPAELMREIDKLRRLDPELPRLEDTDPVVDVLREVRANLSDLALPDQSIGTRRINRDATRLIKAIDEVLDNPVNAADGEFAELWGAARRAAKKRFATREQLAVAEVIRRGEEGTLSELGSSLIQPGAFDKLVMLARTSGNQALEPVRDAFRTELMRDPYNITSRLAEFDKPTLSVLMSSSERRVWKAAGEVFDNVDRAGLRKALQTQTKVGPFVRELIDNPSTASLDALARVIQDAGGSKSEVGRSVRAAVMDEVWKRSHVTDGTAKKLSAKKLNQVMDDFRDRGVLQFLTVSEKKILRNIEVLQRVSDIITDAGTSIQAASAAAGLRTLSASAISTFVEQVGVGRLMTTDAGRRLLVGLGHTKPPTNENVIRLAGSVAATLFTPETGGEQ